MTTLGCISNGAKFNGLSALLTYMVHITPKWTNGELFLFFFLTLALLHPTHAGTLCTLSFKSSKPRKGMP